MRQVYSGVLGFLGFLLALVLFGTLACGGSDQSAEQAQTGGSANGFTTYAVDSQHFSIAVPSSWETASVDKVLSEDAVDQLR